MKAKELMIGDWITIYDVPCRYHYYDGLFYGADKNGSVHHTDDSSLINPIPLTQEILEKNNVFIDKGEDGDIDYYLHETIKDGFFFIKFFEDTYHISAYGYKIGINGRVQFVHEIQHALRLCGLEDIADNFKV